MITKLDEIAYNLYYNNVIKYGYGRFDIKTFIDNKYFFTNFYIKANIQLRKEKLKIIV